MKTLPKCDIFNSNKFYSQHVLCTPVSDSRTELKFDSFIEFTVFDNHNRRKTQFENDNSLQSEISMVHVYCKSLTDKQKDANAIYFVQQ